MDNTFIYMFDALRHMAYCKDREESLLEMIWKYHTGVSAIKSDLVKEKMEMMEQYMQPLSQKRKRIIMARIGDICAECERMAFIEGVRTGSKLIQELRGEDTVIE